MHWQLDSLWSDSFAIEDVINVCHCGFVSGNLRKTRYLNEANNVYTVHCICFVCRAHCAPFVQHTITAATVATNVLQKDWPNDNYSNPIQIHLSIKCKRVGYVQPNNAQLPRQLSARRIDSMPAGVNCFQYYGPTHICVVLLMSQRIWREFFNLRYISSSSATANQNDQKYLFIIYVRECIDIIG